MKQRGKGESCVTGRERERVRERERGGGPFDIDGGSDTGGILTLRQ